jgi:hypothetical protein
MFFQIKGPLNLILTILLGLKEKTSCEHYHWIQWYFHCMQFDFLCVF